MIFLNFLNHFYLFFWDYLKILIIQTNTIIKIRILYIYKLFLKHILKYLKIFQFQIYFCLRKYCEIIFKNNFL